MEYLGYFFNERISDRSELTPSSQLAPLPPPPPPPPPHQDTQAYEKGNIQHSKDQIYLPAVYLETRPFTKWKNTCIVEYVDEQTRSWSECAAARVSNAFDVRLWYKSSSPAFASHHRNVRISKKGKRQIQGVPQSQAAALPRHQEEEETDKTKQAQVEQTYEKH